MRARSMGRGEERPSISPLVVEVGVRSTAGEGQPEPDDRACDQNIECRIFLSVALDLLADHRTPWLRRPLPALRATFSHKGEKGTPFAQEGKAKANSPLKSAKSAAAARGASASIRRVR